MSLWLNIEARTGSQEERPFGGYSTRLVEPYTDAEQPMKAKRTVTSHREYLAGLPNDKRAALEKLRRVIRSAVPTAEECMSYQLPAFRLSGKVLVLFGATATHCSFYPGSGTAVEAHRDDLKGYRTSKGTIRFDAAKPLPAALVRKIIKYRIAENVAQPI